LEPLDESIHKTFLDIFKKYLIVGGMPEAVNTYINTNSMVSIQNVQNSIYQLYIKDSSQYAKEKTLYIEKIYKYMSSVMSSTKKRIVLNDIKENMRGTDASDDFIWLEKSGLAIPVYKTNSIEIPLVHYTNNYYLKLYYNDVGILSSILFKDIQNEILDDKISVNLGSIYENYVAQELRCNIDDLFYYDNRKYGEIDFIFQKLPDVTIIEVKSGKDYYVHSALNNLLKNKTYNISKAIVLSNNNISVKDGIKYLPIYMTMFLTNDKFTKNIIL
jgi:predicted AAA+ superfamily ATPase